MLFSLLKDLINRFLEVFDNDDLEEVDLGLGVKDVVISHGKRDIEDWLRLQASCTGARVQLHVFFIENDEIFSVSKIDCNADIIAFKVEDPTNVVLPGLTSNDSEL